MNYYIGLDIGTSSVKAMLISDDEIIGVVSRDYPISFPKPNYSEQNPEDWYNESILAIKELTKDGDCNISLGTSGTVFVCTDKFKCDRENAIHAFCSANGKYHYLACTLTAASSQKWWIEDILDTDYTYSISDCIGKTDVLFLPYLMGERSPVNDTSVRGMFCNLSMNTKREEMTLAVLEGVAFSIKQNIEIIKSLGVDITKSKICGGGAKNREWVELLATIFDLNIEIPTLEHGGVLGACILASKGVGNDILNKFYGIKDIVAPNKDLVEYYNSKYQKYLKLYPMAKMI